MSLCGLLQGAIQASLGASALYGEQLGIYQLERGEHGVMTRRDWELGIMNAVVFFVAAVVGAPLALVVNYLGGRRYAIAISAWLNIAAAVAAAFAVPNSKNSHAWIDLLCVRIIAGVAMGLKAVSAPVLASEAATGYWRGSMLLSWQLWDAFGILLTSGINLGLAQIGGAEQVDEKSNGDPVLALRLILAFPLIPAVVTLVSVAWCFESPRFHMRRGSPNYNPNRALQILLKLRDTKIQALRDLFIIRWSEKSEQNEAPEPLTDRQLRELEKPGLTYAEQFKNALAFSARQVNTLFSTLRLQNACITVAIINFAQQASGINALAFYSNTLFRDQLGRGNNEALAMTLAFGAVNFIFCVPAIRSIDTAGRRTWLLITLPIMSLFLLTSACCLIGFDAEKAAQSDVKAEPKLIAAIVFLFLFAVAYSPSLGPIPFTLLSESFPLSHREAGAAWGVFFNFFFAGILMVVYPAMNTALQPSGALATFSGLNLLVLVIVYFFLEETRRLNLEELNEVFKHSKRKHARYQREALPRRLEYFWRRYLRGDKRAPRPETYDSWLQDQPGEDSPAAQSLEHIEESSQVGVGGLGIGKEFDPDQSRIEPLTPWN